MQVDEKGEEEAEEEEEFLIAAQANLPSRHAARFFTHSTSGMLDLMGENSKDARSL